VLVEDLAAHFALTPQTIRKDLNELCDRRILIRTHGGALFTYGAANLEYEQRRTIAAAQKQAIGAAAARLIPNRASLFINIGTTTEAVADALLEHDGLLVITNNINVANRMRVFPSFEVIIAGGAVRASDGGIVGEAAIDFIEQFKVDFAVIGTSAIDPDGSLLDFDVREVKVAQAILANARHAILVADSSKFERTAPVRIAHISMVHTFITDRCRPAGIRNLCRDAGVDIIEAGMPGGAAEAS
jgi:DeoR family transcriptional regulator, glycerol-3-phosphate regulon repressor